ncbi:ribulokinase [Nigerium massiliense]|uniref:ribulokinase n=1 Tax=Nigerium massiliense TaxID=1522317 RepID=UPI00058E4513|nr:ribulokinase [Nigerium massiliense]
MGDKYVVGIDFGTLSGRAGVFRLSDGKEMGTALTMYKHGVMDRTLSAADNQNLPPDFALQAPADYIDVLKNAVPGALKEANVDPNDVVAVGLDATSATLFACKADGTPLCELDEFKNNPHAWVKLWKHHGAQEQADRIVALARERDEAWLPRYGGVMSSELGMPKMLETLEKAPEVYQATEVFANLVDWLVWKLTGTLTYAAGDSGYKRMYIDGAYPSTEYLEAHNPEFGGVFSEKQTAEVLPLGAKAGELTEEAAGWTGLPAGITVSTGNIDAHVAAAAFDALQPGQLTAIMGTSSCWLVPGEELKEVPGMFGVVDGGLVEGSWGFECGQTAVGDIFAWFVENTVPAHYYAEAARLELSVHEFLSRKAEELKPGESGLLALDWHNGNRSVLADANLSGMIVGLTLATQPEEIYRALIEGTAFGARMIVETFEECGVAINEIICGGGLIKNRFLMRTYANILNRKLGTCSSMQPGALGSAIFAAVAAGEYPDAPAAAAAMGARDQRSYEPDAEAAKVYDELYAEWKKLHDYFGRGENPVMHNLKNLVRRVRGEATQ